MTTIEDLPQKSISEMSIDESLELLRQIRLSRHVKKTTTRKPSTKAKSKKTPDLKLSKEQASQLLKILTGE